jgi:signal transduction histidine kinase/ActR/RegA family two-component response regulator
MATLVTLALIGAGILAALIVSEGEANRQRDRALALQQHSFDVVILARSLSGTIARSEATLGRYVISADRHLGQQYYEQWQTAGQQLNRLDSITDDNASQQPRIDLLRRAYVSRGSELSLIALATAYKRYPQALSRYYAARQAASLAAIDRQLDEIIAAERTLLDQRTTAANASVARSTGKARGLTVVGVMLALGAIVLGWLTVRAQAERARAQAEADEERRRTAELEAAVIAATDELRAQEARLRQAQKMDAIGQLTGGIAHDFNNMLAVVLGGLELARRHIGDEAGPWVRHLDSATEGARRAAALTRQLLAFSRDEALRPEPVVPGALIAGMRDLLDRTLGDGIIVEVADAAGDQAVFADRVALENTVLNLAVNARDAMDGRGRLRIGTGATVLTVGEVGGCDPGEYVTLVVADDGCGMAPDVLERVFEPFFTTKPVGKGTGLGLSQVFALVRQLGGGIAIASTPGGGTAVTLYIPRHAAGPAVVAPAESVAEQADGIVGPLGILVVEDDPRVLVATMGALGALGHRAVACGDPLAAPALLEEDGSIDLVVSDVLMPGQTGPEMVAGLLARRPALAILFVTGYAGDGVGAEAFGSHDVLRKPFTLVALERAVARAVARRSPAHIPVPGAAA